MNSSHFDQKVAIHNLALIALNKPSGSIEEEEMKKSLGDIVAKNREEALAFARNLREGEPGKLETTDFEEIRKFNTWTAEIFALNKTRPLQNFYILLSVDSHGNKLFDQGRSILTVSRYDGGQIYTIYDVSEGQKEIIARGTTIARALFDWLCFAIRRNFIENFPP